MERKLENKHKPEISIVIPVYGCKEVLFDLYRRLRRETETITDDFEIIMVNDACPLNSWAAIVDLHAMDSRIYGINLSRNFGQHYAITAGLDASSGAWIVVMDCDLQDRPEEIKKLYAKALEGFDIVMGRRQVRKDPFLRKVNSKLFYSLLSYLTDTQQDGAIANYGIYKREVIDAIIQNREHIRYLPVMARSVGFTSIAIDIEHNRREHGKSTYTLRKLINMSVDVMLAFSYKPLKLTVKAGMLISLISFLYAVFIVMRALVTQTVVQGWASLFVSLWFLSGVIIFVLGMVGVYVGKTFEESKKKPIYIIKEKLFK